MPRPPTITDAEWAIMKVLWDRPGEWLPAGQVVAPVSKDRGTHHRTVRTLLSRLVKKGAVDARSDTTGAAYLYKAKVGRDAVVREESRSFLSRVFDGNAAPALVHFLKESRQHLSEEDLAELRALLNRREKP
jgi:BlaI family penicillinase repressor